MNIKNLTPVKIESQEALDRVEKATRSQEISNSVPRVFDPNFPIFRFETNNKHLVYVPNFYTEDENGKKDLLRESAYIHTVTKGRQFMQLRSTHGLTGLEDLGISGQSPLMEATSECWELYNLKYAQVAEQMGIDPSDDKGEVLKPKRVELLGQRTVKDPDLRHYFPIVVFETEKDSKTGINTFKFVQDSETKAPKYQIMWMDVSDSQWNETWMKVMDSLDDNECLAGQLLALNYHFSDDISSEKNPRRDSGRALKISIRPKDGNKEFFEYLDEQAKDWKPSKAREVIIACALLTDEQQQEIVDDAMQNTRLEIDTIKKMQLTGGSTQPQIETSTPDSALASFGGAEESNEDSSTSKGLQFGGN